MPDIFVGEERHAIVEQLLGLFDEVRSVDTKQEPAGRLVVLASPPGWGKTRIVHELYRRLAEAQPQPPYWPLTIMGPDARDDGKVATLTAARKRVHPPKTPGHRGARMEWMWWGLLCQQDIDDGLRLAMQSDTDQLRAHQVGLGSGNRQAAVDGAFTILELVASPVPFVGGAVTAIGVARTAFGHRDRLREVGEEVMDVLRRDASDRPIDVEASSHHDEFVAQMIDGLARLTKSVPTVLVLDDAHFADEATCRVLDAVLRRRESRLLVIAAGWPSHLDNVDAARPFTETWRRFRDELPTQSTRITLAPLAEHHVHAVIEAELPGASALSAAIYERFESNLLATRAVLRLPRVRAAVDAGTPTAEILATLPTKVEEVFEEYWEGLPEEIQTLLALAAHAPAHEYLPDLIAAAAETQGLVERARERIAEGVEPYAWVREIDRTVHSFMEPILRDVAVRGGKDLLLQEHIDALDAAVLDAVMRVDETELSPLARDTLRQYHFALVKEGRLPTDERALESARSLAESFAARYEYRRAVGVFETVLTWPTPEQTELVLRYELAGWLGRAGRVAEAAAQCETLLADRTRVLGPDHPDTLRTRSSLASWLGEAGRVDEAAAQFEALLADRTRVLGPDHPDTLTTRNNLATMLGEIGRVEEAIERFEALIADRARVLGPDHPETLQSRHNLAHWVGGVGRVEEAAVRSKALLADRIRVLGPDHPETLQSQHNLAYFLGQTGRVEEAIERSKALLADRIRVLGPDHPETLMTRLNLASQLGRAGRLDDAIALNEMLLGDQIRVLGPDHPLTLMTRSNHTYWLDLAGHVEKTIAQSEALLADRLRVLGPGHPETLKTRNNLAVQLGKARRTEEAIGQFEALLTDQAQVLGADHPTVLTARHNLAYFLGQTGRVEEAAAQFETLLPDRARVLGPDHPDTLTTRNNFAYWLGKARRVEQSAEQYETLLADQTRLLGPDHPDTMTTQRNFRFYRRLQWARRAGRATMLALLVGAATLVSRCAGLW